MSKIQAAIHKVGISNDPANNFLLDASAQDGSLVIKRESGQLVCKINNKGKVVFPQNKQTIAATTYTGTTVIATNQTTLTTNITATDAEGTINPTTGIFKPTTEGYYQINATLSSGAAQVTGLGCTIRRTGGSGTKKTEVQNGTSLTSAYLTISVSDLFYLNGTTDQVDIQAYSAAGNFTGTCIFSAFLVKEVIT